MPDSCSDMFKIKKKYTDIKHYIEYLHDEDPVSGQPFVIYLTPAGTLPKSFGFISRIEPIEGVCK